MDENIQGDAPQSASKDSLILPISDSVPKSERKDQRFESLDFSRGVIMIIMSIDHAREALNKTGFVKGELLFEVRDDDVNVLLYITRYITHLSAPGFYLLMGISMILFYNSRIRNNWPIEKIAKHFIIRGLVLIVAEFVFFAVMIIPRIGHFTLFQLVLTALGINMIFGTLILYIVHKLLITSTKLARYSLLGFTFLFITMNSFLLISIPESSDFWQNFVIAIFFAPHAYYYYYVVYPIMTWLGVVCLGQFFGLFFIEKDQYNDSKPFKIMLILGIIFWLLFCGLRFCGVFFTSQPVDPPIKNAEDFFSVVKYPPSILFLLITLGGNFFILSISHLTKIHKYRIAIPALAFGKTALFFYIVHHYILWILGFLITCSLPMMFLYWALVVIVMYPLCYYYGKFKHKTSPDSIWRFF